MSNQTNQSQSLRAAWVVCLIAGLFFLFEFIQLSSFDALNRFVQDYYKLNASQVSILGSAFLWGNVVFLIPAGMLLDIFGSRKCILSSLLLAINGLVLFAFSSSFNMAFAGRFLSGIGNAFCFVSLVVLVSRWFPSNKQAFAMGLLVNMAFIGGMFAHTPLVWLLDHFGWKHIMWANVGFGLGVWFLIWLYVYDMPKGQENVSVAQPQNLTFKEVFKQIINVQNFGAGFYTSCLNLPILVLCALWGIQFLKVAHQLTTVQASNVVTMIFFGSMLGSPIIGLLSDRMQKRKPLMWVGGIISLVLCIPLCLMKQALPLSSLMLIFFALGVFTSTQVLSYPLLAESNSSKFAGRACSFASMIIMGGGMVAQLLFGTLLTSKTSLSAPDANAFRFAMLMFPVSIMLALFALFGMKETFCKHRLES